MSEKRIPKRSEQEKEYTWAIEDIYASDELWKADLEKLKSLVDRIGGFKGKLGESGKALYEYFTLFFDETVILCNSLSNYAQRKSDEDTTNSTYQAMTGQIMNVYVAINSASSFQDSELIAIPDEKLDAEFIATYTFIICPVIA